jgi:hypothetical protein
MHQDFAPFLYTILLRQLLGRWDEVDDQGVFDAEYGIRRLIGIPSDVKCAFEILVFVSIRAGRVRT